MPTPRQVARNLRQLNRKIPLLAIRALKAAQITVGKDTTAEIVELTKLKNREVKKESLKIKSVRQTGNHFIAKLTYRPFARNLAGKQFRPKMIKTKRNRRGQVTKRGGLRVRIYGESRLIKGGFIANSGRTAFIRTSRRRLPIIPLVGPSPRRQFQNQNRRQMIEVFQTTAITRFSSVFRAKYAEFIRRQSSR